MTAADCDCVTPRQKATRIMEKAQGIKQLTRDRTVRNEVVGNQLAQVFQKIALCSLMQSLRPLCNQFRPRPIDPHHIFTLLQEGVTRTGDRKVTISGTRRAQRRRNRPSMQSAATVCSMEVPMEVPWLDDYSP